MNVNVSIREAERLLSNKPVGCFLIRVGETRIGYTLSIQDEARCRHYMLDELEPNAYRIIGEQVVHKSLCDLVEYYKKVTKDLVSIFLKYTTSQGPTKPGHPY